MEFSGTEHQRIIDRTTVLTADTIINLTDAKDGLYGIRLAHALQIPDKKIKEFKDDKGNVTIVKGVKDSIANGNYLTSEGKQGDDAWSTRGRWCKVYGKMGNDSISIAIIDHPKTPTILPSGMHVGMDYLPLIRLEKKYLPMENRQKIFNYKKEHPLRFVTG